MAANPEWKLIPIDLGNLKKLKMSEPRNIPLNSSQPLLDPRLKPLQIPNAPHIYFNWAPTVNQQAPKIKKEEYFEENKPTFTWHLPPRSQLDEKLLSNGQDDTKPPANDLEEGGLPPAQLNDSIWTDVEMYRTNGWLSDK